MSSGQSRIGNLFSGAVWEGVQKSGRCQYEVSVTIDCFNLEESRIQGTINIKNLLPNLVELITYFEGEVIGFSDYTDFITRNYGALPRDDIKHWSRFRGYRTLSSQEKSNFDGRDRDFLFLRFKEKFVVNTKLEVHGASFAGFYYMCLDLRPPVLSLPNTRYSLSKRSGFRSTNYVDSSLDESEEEIDFRGFSTYAAALSSPPLSSTSIFPSTPATAANLIPLSIPEHQSGTQTPKEEFNPPLNTTLASPELIGIPLPFNASEDEFPRVISTSPTLLTGEREFNLNGRRNSFGLERKITGAAWNDSILTGFYFHCNSEPYQELSLKFVDTNKGASELFAFR